MILQYNFKMHVIYIMNETNTLKILFNYFNKKLTAA